MKFAKDIYIDDALFDEYSKVKRMIRYGYGRPDGYALIRNELTGKTEAIHLKYLKQKYYKNSRQEIIGLIKEYHDVLIYLAREAARLYGSIEDASIESEGVTC